ncbi:SRPBCC family protein [Streptacidiphilus jiangxiensis]|uniref:Carbon monoxide dehydrogenase subunit G n=1 Tax=Streptacidiphilus jiangxiensis TaxID=235985 RepID=A0A1H7ZAL5_STRJI|nr:SRPBCC family protein [Streptacidiphilus jiangxiensis]SEM55592.1 Carbon monoxide dehydrogenase subunit G [Streptacidiphilus jiangxiensis]
MAITVVRSFRVATPAPTVASYLEDFSNTEQWDPGTVRCRRLDPGPLAVGARWENTSRFRGRQATLDYRLVTREPHRLVFHGVNRTVSATDDIAIRPHGDGSLVTYRATLTFKGLLRFAEPILRRSFEDLADAVQVRLRHVLDALPPAPPDPPS